MTLYEAGKDAMEKEFRNLLARHGRPVPPGSLIDVLALEHGNYSYLLNCYMYFLKTMRSAFSFVIVVVVIAFLCFEFERVVILHLLF